MIDTWVNCYDDGWKGLITDESFAHPAKFSHGLIRRIYRHLLEDGLLKPGDTVVDCFAGVALGALYAQKAGLNWLGCELEPRFVDLGAGCECTGISKQEWVRFYGRWDRVALTGGRYWCPRCLTQARQVKPPANGQMNFIAPEPTAAYTRDSGKIPYTLPHHFTGNLELFTKHARYGAQAQLIQGDSRKLAELVSGAAVVTSPPYAEQQVNPGNVGNAIKRETWGTGKSLGGGADKNGYGSTPGQLGAMKAGDVGAVISSPPDAESSVEFSSNTLKGGRVNGDTLRLGKSNKADYGAGAGNLGNLKEGQLDALVTSPPFAGNSGGRGEASRNGIDAALFDRHSGGMVGGMGDDPANLGNLRGVELGGVVTSPPWNAEPGDHKDREDYGTQGNGRLAKSVGEHMAMLGDQGETFWQAARTIVSQCAIVLPSGAPAVWVVKDFVKAGHRVEFSQQWAALCEACGFRVVHIHRAMLVKDGGTALTLEGQAVTKTVARKSFFRRLAEKNGSPAIDYETVLCTVRV